MKFLSVFRYLGTSTYQVHLALAGWSSPTESDFMNRGLLMERSGEVGQPCKNFVKELSRGDSGKRVD